MHISTDSGGFLIGDKIMTHEEEQKQQRQRRQEKKRAIASFKTVRYWNPPTKRIPHVYHSKLMEVDEFLIQPHQDEKQKSNIKMNSKNKTDDDNKNNIKMNSKKRAMQIQKRWKQLQQQKQQQTIQKSNVFKQDNQIKREKRVKSTRKSCKKKKKIPIIYFNEFFIREDQLQQ